MIGTVKQRRCKLVSNPESRTDVTRREALLLSTTVGLGAALNKPAFGSDSVKTGAHQEPGNVSTPRSAIAKTQYGKVRGFVDGGVLTFKGVPYGATTAGEKRGSRPSHLRRGQTNIQPLCREQTVHRICTPGPASSKRSSLIGMTGGRVRTC
jgi:hypothetical protein